MPSTLSLRLRERAPLDGGQIVRTYVEPNELRSLDALLREAADALEKQSAAFVRIAALSSHEFSPPDIAEDLTRWETTHQRIARLAKEALGDGPWPRAAGDDGLSHAVVSELGEHELCERVTESSAKAKE